MRVSLITASYNSADTIAETLRSVATQTYPDIEHILIDGASKDHTLAVVESEGKHLARVVSEPDRGIFNAYNKGLKMATGDIIGILNSDDFYLHDRVIERVVEAFEDPEIDAVHADMIYVRRDDISKVVRHWKSGQYTKRSIRRGFHPGHPTLFLRRSVYDRVGDFDESYRMASDVEFMNRLFYRYGVRHRHFPEIWVTMRDGGTTGGNLASIRRQNREVRRGQSTNGISYPKPLFFLHKILDRTLQRVRAPFVQLPKDYPPK